MKKINLILIALLALVACKKENASNLSNGTIVLATGITSGTVGQQATIGIPKSTFSALDGVTDAGLMAANNLSANGFVFYAYSSYYALNQNNQIALYQFATARQVRNDLAVFFNDLVFPFENGKFNEPYPAPQYIVGTITLDNKPSLALQTLRQIFIKTDNTNEAHNIAIGDSTLVAQMGYYNLNISQMPVGGTPDYIKAWYVHPQHSYYPEGYFRDDNGAVLGFQPLTHSGPVTF